MSAHQAENEESVRSNSAGSRTMYCPSAQPGRNGSMIIGLVEKDDGISRVKILPHPVKVTLGTLAALTSSEIPATDIFRFASPCQTSQCLHWRESESKCGVATGLIQIMPKANEKLPACTLRAACRWFAQEGQASCGRCANVITHDQHLYDNLLQFQPLEPRGNTQAQAV